MLGLPQHKEENKCMSSIIAHIFGLIMSWIGKNGSKNAAEEESKVKSNVGFDLDRAQTKSNLKLSQIQKVNLRSTQNQQIW